MDPITNILDRRLPQPYDWQTLPPHIRERVEALARERATCPDERVEKIDLEWLGVLLPFARPISVSQR